MRANTHDGTRAWAFAEIVIAAYSFIGHMERLRLGGQDNVVSGLALRASRMVLDTTVEYYHQCEGTRHAGVAM